jgi:hypothetical protein
MSKKGLDCLIPPSISAIEGSDNDCSEFTGIFSGQRIKNSSDNFTKEYKIKIMAPSSYENQQKNDGNSNF